MSAKRMRRGWRWAGHLLALGLGLVLGQANLWRQGAAGGEEAEATPPRLGLAVQAAEQAPAQPTPGDPPAVPTPSGDRVWRLRLRAFPDTVGKGAYRCTGCDGVLSSGDIASSTARALEPLQVVVLDPADESRPLWVGRLKRSQPGQVDVTAQILLTVPPPYEVRLIDQSPRGFTLCPNASSSVHLSQADFDAAVGGAPDSGRSYALEWFFWSCRAELP